MSVVLALCLGLWALGWVMGARPVARLLPVVLVLTGALAAKALLPLSHPVSVALGGTFAGWATGLGALALFIGYAALIGAIRRRAALRAGAQATEAAEAPEPPASAPVMPASFSPDELDRYARHVVLRDIGGPGQRALKQARVLVVGAGGLGSPALLYLAAAGVGTIVIVDDDVVDNSNLQRQIIHRAADIGTPKVLSAARAMRARNPDIAVEPHQARLDESNAHELIAGVDLVLEGSDNFATRYLVNRVAAGLGKPVVGAALSQWEGQISVWDPVHGAPCYQCVFPEPPARGLVPSCAEAGVLGPLPGVLGSMMAVEAVKLIARAGEPLRGRMLIYDALYAEVRIIKVARRPDCPVCAGIEAKPEESPHEPAA